MHRKEQSSLNQSASAVVARLPQNARHRQMLRATNTGTPQSDNSSCAGSLYRPAATFQVLDPSANVLPSQSFVVGQSPVPRRTSSGRWGIGCQHAAQAHLLVIAQYRVYSWCASQACTEAPTARSLIRASWLEKVVR